LVSYLEAHRGNAEYLVAAFGSQSSAPIIIASGEPVITIGGFNGADPAPTLAQFEALVAAGKVRYVLVSGGGGFGGPGGGSSAITTWVTAHGTAVTYGATSSAGTLYLVSN
jgi:4-amino-4-deoxy-L-arabinose transferase-like glycosyltransferase